MTELFKAGGISGIPVSVGDVLVSLQTGLLQTVFAPPLAAVSMQWHTRVKFRNDTRLMYSVGGVFLSARSWEKIPADLRPTVKEIFAKHLAELRVKVRKSNDEALQVLEKQLGDRDYLVGESYSLVEVCYTPFVQFLPLTEVSAPPAVAAWIERLLARPSARRTEPAV